MNKQLKYGLTIVLSTILSALSFQASGLQMLEQLIKPSTGAVVPGEWNKNFDAARAKADSEHIPMIVFYGGVSCGVCELLQQALITEQFTTWQAERKLIMVFTTDNTLGNASSFSTPTATKKQGVNPDAPSEIGFPFIAVYWNRDGVVPEKFSADYRCFRGKSGMMIAKDGSLTDQFINSVECVAGEYPYSGGEFVLPDATTTRLEVEEGYTDGRVVRVPLTRTRSVAAVNYLVCNGTTNCVEWAAGETEKLVDVIMPNGIKAGKTVDLQLLASGGQLHSTSTIAVVAAQGNSVRNPKWIGESFTAGEWTMDLDEALAQTASGTYDNTLILFTGALWCPHCQALESAVFGTDTFKNWAVSHNIALVELDNPRRSGSTVAEDCACHEVKGAGPTLLRYEVGSNSYLSRQESGASYLTRKDIAVGNATTPGTAEYVLQRNRRLGYEWGDGTYCAPDGSRCGYPTVILLNGDGTIAGRWNRLEGTDYSYDLTENMHRLDALLRLSGGDGESANYPKTTTRTASPGGSAVTANFQVNDRVEYFSLSGIPTGRISFTAAGAPAGNPVKLSVVRYADGKQTVVAESETSVACAVASENNLFLKAEAYTASRAYGDDAGFSATISSALILVPAEKTAVMQPEGRSLQLEVVAGAKYRLEGFSGLDSAIFRDDGVASDGGRYYTALAGGAYSVGYSGDSVEYQIWRPGVIAFEKSEMTLFKASGMCTVRVLRSGGSSGPVSVNVKVTGGDAVNGVRYDWDNSTVVSWADGESDAVDLNFQLKDYEEFMPNQTAILGLSAGTDPVNATISGASLKILICDTDKPTLAKTSYDISAFATFDASAALDPQQAYNVDASKVTIKKVSGSLPRGVKLVYEDGQVKLSGSATKTGTYSYTFTLQQKQDGKTVTGPEITMNFTIPAASDTAAGGNAFLDKAIKATLPLYEEEDGTNLLAGVIEYSITKKNVIKAKCCFLEKKSITFKGRWATASGSNVETGVLTYKDGRSLRLRMDAEGAMTAVVANPASGTELATFGTLKVVDGASAAPYDGYYTVSMSDIRSDDPMGNGYVLIKSIGSNGKAKWVWMLANGKQLSGTAVVTVDDAGNAVLPVFKYKSDNWAAASLKIRPNGSTLAFPRAVLDCDGAIGRWSHCKAPTSLHYVKARGCWYGKRRALDECCYLQFFGNELTLSADLDGYSSFAYGTAPQSPEAKVIVYSDDLKLSVKSNEIKMKFAMKTGVFAGTMKLAFAEKTVTAKYKGVVIPGWHDCNCEVPNPNDPYRIDVSQPFAMGAAWFGDKIDGKSVNRGFTIKIDESGY